jgi:GT2 family glycosyltransferase
MKKVLNIIVTTYNSEEYLNPCVSSILKTGIVGDVADLHIVNNGKQDIERMFGNIPNVFIHNTGENLGWERGIKYAYDRTDAPLVVFQNDDTLIPPSSILMYKRLMSNFSNDKIVAAGPATTCASGLQSIMNPAVPYFYDGSFLSNFLLCYVEEIRC